MHYREHKDKPFYSKLIAYITSGPIAAMVIQGENSVSVVRTLIGDTAGNTPGTIRGDWANNITRNLVHGSDSEESAGREIDFFFKDGETII